jgi:acetyl-CoA carboxylase carboxyl transferase subunit beta
MVDAVVHRHKLRETLIRLVSLLMDPVTAEGRSLAVAGR